MPNRFLVAMIAVAMAGLGLWAFAQQTQPAPERSNSQSDQFAVSAVGSSAVMVEAASGRTWMLRHSADRRSAVWLPLERIDEPERALMWLEKEEAIRHDLLKQREQSQRQ